MIRLLLKVYNFFSFFIEKFFYRNDTLLKNFPLPQPQLHDATDLKT